MGGGSEGAGMNITEHFTLQELTVSDYAIRHGIDNLPTDPDVMANLYLLADGLEAIRRLLNAPIHISSGYRCPKLNSAVRGSKSSAHMIGLAADFTAPNFGSPREIARAIADSDIGFEQLIFEGSWVHVAFPPYPNAAHRMVMTAVFKGGSVSYIQGVA